MYLYRNRIRFSEDLDFGNFDYLNKNLQIKNNTELKNQILKNTATLNFKTLSKDVEPLLFNPNDKKKVILFREFIEQSI